MVQTRNVVNLDALIPREDLSAPVDGATGDIPGLKITDLAPGVIYNWLRKPDFQRETASWSPEQVADLIHTFAMGSIIPAIILWQNGQRVFVVDGAHRLSALVAWVQDDYGAGALSARACGNAVPEQQRAMHETTKKLVNERVRSYEEHKMAADYPKAADPAVLDRAAKFAFRNIEIQWIKNASVEQATDAFFRINQGGTKIDPTETRILRAKNSALAISSRAIARGGTGHNYWRKFNSAEVKTEIERLGAEIHRMLYVPPLRVPVKTTDVPVAGFGYGGHVLPFSFDLVALANDLAIADSSRQKKEVPQIPDDPDGAETVQLLSKVSELVKLLCSNHPSSLGLHPALYFYTAGGAFQPAALFNVAVWFRELEASKRLNAFLDLRGAFEELILSYPVIIKPLTHTLGSGARTRGRTITLFRRVFAILSDGRGPDDTWTTLTNKEEFAYLIAENHKQKEEASKGTPGGRFGRTAKTAGFFEQFLSQVPKCHLCGGLLHTNGMVAHHVVERDKGGSSASANAQMVHPICNSNQRQRSEQ